MCPNAVVRAGSARPEMRASADRAAITDPRWTLLHTFCCLLRAASRRLAGAACLERIASGAGILRPSEVPQGEVVVWVAAEADAAAMDALDRGFPPGEDIPMLAVMDPSKFDRRWRDADGERHLHEVLRSSQAWAGDGRTQRALLVEQALRVLDLVRHHCQGTLLILGDRRR